MRLWSRRAVWRCENGGAKSKHGCLGVSWTFAQPVAYAGVGTVSMLQAGKVRRTACAHRPDGVHAFDTISQGGHMHHTLHDDTRS